MTSSKQRSNVREAIELSKAHEPYYLSYEEVIDFLDDFDRARGLLEAALRVGVFMSPEGVSVRIIEFLEETK